MILLVQWVCRIYRRSAVCLNYTVLVMSLRAAKQLLRKDVKLRILELSEEEKLRQSKVVTDRVRMNVYISGDSQPFRSRANSLPGANRPI